MNSAVTILMSLVSLALIWWAVFWLYRDYRVDLFRQRLFERRDALFDAAAEGRLGFDDPVYGLMRAAANGCIRFAHLFNFAQFIVLAFESAWRKEDEPKFREIVSTLSSDLTADQKTLRDDYLAYMNGNILGHVILGSPILAVTAIAPMVMFFILRSCIGQLVRLLRTPLDRLDKLAYAAGDSQ